ncbi:MAG TPA: sensor histidine kinase [Nocardioides sp.]|uniref:sensor histidine kinase n=1 Tax=Nocardioides sp. TaxID=35761 RepID=UPI002E33247E|nr:sensor histidine kinase [Nocardioides sp.]HEX5087356.1 sensor histidine kinase [Nocardioides sp.]
MTGAWPDRWRRVTTTAADVAVALLLAITSIADVVRGDPSWGEPMAVAVTLALGSTLPLAVRSRLPVTAASLVLVANAGCIYAAAPHEAAFQPFVALALAFYSLGAHAAGRAARWAPVVLLVLSAGLFVVIWQHGQSAGHAVPSFVWLVAAWVVGRGVRHGRLQNAALAAANAELEVERNLRAEAAVAIERGRIARELHDVIAHNVSMMVVQAAAAERILEDGQPQVRQALDTIADTGRQTVDEMRTLLGVLRNQSAVGDRPELAPQPGLGDLEELAAGVRAAGVPVELHIEGPRREVSPALDLSAYRIVQEALTNVLKHAGPAQACVTVRYLAGSLELEVRDTGRGEPGGGARRGHGLVGMRERATMFGGTVETGRGESGGFTVRALLPTAPVSLS